MLSLFNSQLDARSPINRSHPLASNLEDWWLVAPGGHPSFFGGSRQLNLATPFHAVLTNGPTWHGNQGRPGGRGSWKFDGTNDFLDVTKSTDAPYIKSVGLTIMCWANITTGSAIRHFAGKHLTNGATNNPFDFRTDNAGSPLLVLGRANAGGSKQYSGPATTVGSWVHYAVVCTNDQIDVAPTFYVNGVATAGTSSGGTGTGTVTGSNSNIVMGQRPDAAALMLGYMDDIRIYSRALDAAMIYNAYQNSKLGYPGLLNLRRLPLLKHVTGSTIYNPFESPVIMASK